jgi:hypothetical protein
MNRKARVSRPCLLKRERSIGFLNKLRLETALIGREFLKPEQSTTFGGANIREVTPSDEFRLPFAAWEIPVIKNELGTTKNGTRNVHTAVDGLKESSVAGL